MPLTANRQRGHEMDRLTVFKPAPGQVILRWGDTGVTIRCPDCNSNVFTKTEPDHYTCNGCGHMFVGTAYQGENYHDDQTTQA